MTLKSEQLFNRLPLTHQSPLYDLILMPSPTMNYESYRYKQEMDHEDTCRNTKMCLSQALLAEPYVQHGSHFRHNI